MDYLVRDILLWHFRASPAFCLISEQWFQDRGEPPSLHLFASASQSLQQRPLSPLLHRHNIYPTPRHSNLSSLPLNAPISLDLRQVSVEQDRNEDFHLQVPQENHQ